MMETPTKEDSLIRAQLIQALRLASRLDDALLTLATYTQAHTQAETACYLASQQSHLLNMQAELVGLCKQVGESSDAVQQRLMEMLGLPLKKEATLKREGEEDAGHQ